MGISTFTQQYAHLKSTHNIIAKTFCIEGYTVFCPPTFTTGPKGKEAGLVMLVSNEIAKSITIRHDLNNEVDTIPTLWVHLKSLNLKLDIIIGGVYRRFRQSQDTMKNELKQLQQQILAAAKLEKTVVL